MNEPTTNRRRGAVVRPMWAALAFLVAASGLPGIAAGEEPAPEEPAVSKLRFEALPYAWVAGFHGSIAVKDTTIHLDVGIDDLLKLLFDGNAFAASGYFALSYDRFGVFADSSGGYAEMSVSQSIPTQLCCTLSIAAKTKMKYALTDVGLAYELGRWTLPKRERPLTLGVWAGARIMYLSNEVDAKAGVVHGAERSANVFESVDWADPLIGVRWSVPVLDGVDIDFRGDIGGFGASSDLTWGIVGDVRLWLPWKPFDLSPYSVLGYRVVAFDRSPSGATVDLQMRGPILGVGFLF